MGQRDRDRTVLTVGTMVGYVLGALILFAGGSALSAGVLAPGILWTVGGLIGIPLTRDRISRRVGVQLSRRLVIAIVAACLVGGYVIAAMM